MLVPVALPAGLDLEVVVGHVLLYPSRRPEDSRESFHLGAGAVGPRPQVRVPSASAWPLQNGGPLILLVIVPRRDPALYEYLARRFAGVLGVHIILDRRQAERRRESPPGALGRRSGRERRHGQYERPFLGYTFVTLESRDD